MRHSRPLLRFTLAVLALLPASFVVWHFFGTLLTAPAVLVVDFITSRWLDQAIASVQLKGTTIEVLAALGELNGAILPAEQAGSRLGFQIDSRVLSYSLPFYAALHFATPMQSSLERFARGLLVLWILLALGLVATLLKDAMLVFGDTFLAMPGVPPADVIALLYQFSTLIVPPLAPVVLWSSEARDVAAFQTLLPEGLRSESALEAGREVGRGVAREVAREVAQESACKPADQGLPPQRE